MNDDATFTEKQCVDDLKSYKDLFNYSIDGICLHEMIYDREKPINYRIVDANLKYEELTEIKAADAIGSLASDIYGVPEAPYLEKYAEVVRTGRPVIFETYFAPMGKHFLVSAFRMNRDVFATMFRDITKSKRTQEALRESERRYRELFDLSSDAVLFIESDTGQILDANNRALAMFGYSREELLTKKNWELSAEPEETRRITQTKSALDSIVTVPMRYLIRKDGAVFPAEITGRAFVWQNRPVFVAAFRDITERKQIEDALRDSEEKYRVLVDQAADGLVLVDAETLNFVNFNDEACSGLGYSREEFARLSLVDIQENSTKDALLERFLAVLEPGRERFEDRQRKKDGTFRNAIISNRVINLHGRRYISAIWQDVTERKKVEMALRESEEHLDSIFRSAPIGIGLVVNRIIKKANRRLCMLTGYDEEDLIGQSSRILYPAYEDYEIVGREKYAQIRDHGSGTVETRWQRKNGAIIDVLLSSTPIDLLDYSKGVTFTALDITERKEAEEALRKSEERYRQLFNISNDAVFVHLGPSGGMPGRFIEVNVIACERLGYTREELLKMSPPDIDAPETLAKLPEIMARLIEYGHFTWEGIHLTKDGRRIPVEITNRLFDYQGTQMILSSARDISERQQAEEEREKLHSQLMQAQKMESVGRLAGGVAHDYNNMLGVILGRVEMAMDGIDNDHPLFHDLREIQNAAQRSADITRQLLAFARKQTIAPKLIDLNQSVEGMLSILQRLIGEDIALIWRPGYNLWPVKIDSSQLDQILANLCVNARDAITDVGTITIETSNFVFDEVYCSKDVYFVPGDYVMLAISDTGCGMNKEIREHIFEPFFTTKGIGTGTGLGLATVYGIVKQNNGFINVYSEPGRGSIFKIYLPRQACNMDQAKNEEAAKPAKGGHEKILLVEDEPTIMNMTSIMLERLGYSVTAVGTPGEAIQTVDNFKDEIHLLITDLVMPEMNGKDLSEKLLEKQPEMQVLFMSGYTSNVIAHHGVLDEGVHFLQKPFSKKALSSKIRDILDKH